MIAEFLREDKLGMVFDHHKPITLLSKVRVVGTLGLDGYGRATNITYNHGTQHIRIQWAATTPYDLKPGDKVKFTRS